MTDKNALPSSSDPAKQDDIPPIPDNPVTKHYPLLAHLQEEDDSTRLEMFTKVLAQVQEELDRLDPHTDGKASPRQGSR